MTRHSKGTLKAATAESFCVAMFVSAGLGSSIG